jgi:hypothetical protein
MIYGIDVLDQSIQVEESLQLPAQDSVQNYPDLVDVQNGVMKDIERMEDVLPLLNNHILLESMIMNSMTSLQDNPINKLIPATHLCAFIRFNKMLANNSFNRAYLNHMSLSSYARKILKFNNFPECQFIND